MKICEIVNETWGKEQLGFLFYHEKSKEFTIEIKELTDDLAYPIFLHSFVSKGQYTIGPEFALMWVEERIVPADRQNIGEILRENGLKEYDPYKLLMIADGRCAQDDCAVVPIKRDRLPKWAEERLAGRVEFIETLDSGRLAVIFRDGQIRLMAEYSDASTVEIVPGGTGIVINKRNNIQARELRKKGVVLPIDREDFCKLIRSYVMDTQEVCSELNCSRQYVGQLVQKNDLSMLKESGNSRLYTHSDVDWLLD